MANPRVVAVIQARNGSSRLPGKVLRPLGGRPVLEWMVRAARTAVGVDDVVIATSDHTGDDAIAALGSRLGVTVVRGSEDDVLSRFLVAIEASGAEAVVRLTADCPLIDPTLISTVVGAWRGDPTLDYVSTGIVRTLPRGIGVELATARALRLADAEATGHHRSHVTSFLYASEREFRMLGIVVRPDASGLRVTLDTPEDAQVLDELVARLGDRPPAWKDVVATLMADPELVAVNANVRQKSLADG